MHRATSPQVSLHRAKLPRRGLTWAATVLLAFAPAQSLFAQFSSSKANFVPKIIDQPRSLTVEQGQGATFKVEVEADKDVKDATTYSTYHTRRCLGPHRCESPRRPNRHWSQRGCQSWK